MATRKKPKEAFVAETALGGLERDRMPGPREGRDMISKAFTKTPRLGTQSPPPTTVQSTCTQRWVFGQGYGQKDAFVVMIDAIVTQG
jgi:hypothetical protein